jgi:hypothetical protein
MTQPRIDLIQYRLNRAWETLGDARKNLEGGLIFTAANRCYYAAFYAVSALLLTKGKSSSKHSGVLSLFQSHIIQKGLVSQEYGKFYSRLFKYRLKADYEDFAELDGMEVKNWLDKTEEFLKIVDAATRREIKP